MKITDNWFIKSQTVSCNLYSLWFDFFLFNIVVYVPYINFRYNKEDSYFQKGFYFEYRYRRTYLWGHSKKSYLEAVANSIKVYKNA